MVATKYDNRFSTIFNKYINYLILNFEKIRFLNIFFKFKRIHFYKIATHTNRSAINKLFKLKNYDGINLLPLLTTRQNYFYMSIGKQ